MTEHKLTTYTKYQEHSVEEVLRHFIAWYTLPPGDELVTADWFLDPAKGKVLIRLVMKEGQP